MQKAPNRKWGFEKSVFHLRLVTTLNISIGKKHIAGHNNIATL